MPGKRIKPNKNSMWLAKKRNTTGHGQREQEEPLPPVRLTASRTRGSAHALATLGSMLSIQGSASVSPGRVGPHIMGAVKVRTGQRGRLKAA